MNAHKINVKQQQSESCTHQCAVRTARSLNIRGTKSTQITFGNNNLLLKRNLLNFQLKN